MNTVRYKMIVDTMLPPGRVAAVIFKAALDGALMLHRAEYLPQHFIESARQRYAQAYATTGVRKRAMKFKELLAGMSWEEKKDFFDSRRMGGYRAELKTRLWWKDHKNKIPLVDTGRMRDAVLRGHVDHTGPVALRSLVFSAAPWYATVSKPEQLQKEAAVQAVIPSEERAFARLADEIIQAHIDGRRNAPAQE